MTRTASRPRRASSASRAASPPSALNVALEWIERHCVVPDGFHAGRPFRPYDWQFRYLGAFYLVRSGAVWDPANPVRAAAFVYRRGLVVGPQKLGKDPMAAAQVCLEGVGPALFGGFAGADEGYVCAEHDCRCGWEYPYDLGEPRGMAWPTPLIQITGVSEDATDNTYDSLRPMIDRGPLTDVIPKTGEEFIRLPGGGRIETVTSSAPSRLGQRTTFAVQGEAGLYTKIGGMEKVADTQYRNLAGMGGRATLLTNPWDPTQRSIAQREHDQADKDLLILFDRVPAGLRFEVRAERAKAIRRAYPPEVRRENGGHVDLADIEAEASSMAKHDPAQAARFFGQQLMAGAGKAFDHEAWMARSVKHVVPDGTLITWGFDGSKSGDQTALIACDIVAGYLWPVGIWDPYEHHGSVPVDDVHATIADLHARYRVVRGYADPPYWKEELATWQGLYGDKVVLNWETWRNREMGWACRSFATAITDGSMTHSGDPRLSLHVGNCNRRGLTVRDEQGAPLWTVQKETPDSPHKIDAAVAAVLAWEARLAAMAAGLPTTFTSIYETRGVLQLGA